MKSFKLFILCLLFLLIGCVKHVNVDQYNEEFNKQQIIANTDSIFGVSFPEDKDWSMINNNEINIHIIGYDVKTVQILCLVNEPNEDNEYTTSMFLINESSDISSNMKIKCDIPNDYIKLYCNFILNDGKQIIKSINDNEVTYSNKSLTRGNYLYDLPSGDFKISSIIPSYAAERGWITYEKLYEINDYQSMKISVPDYDDEYKDIFRSLVFSVFKNGRKYNNLPLVKASGYYNENIYPITTGGDPIFVSVVYKNDGGYKEVENSDLYYYYYKENLKSSQSAYLEYLPKYKAIPLKDCIKGDNVISKHTAYALLYFGDELHQNVGKQGSFEWPAGYKIGFMVRAKTTAENGKKQGELYGDGRLNNYINKYDKCNFKSSKLGDDGPRATWLTVNDRLLMCWESGTDADFNDIILEVEGGIYGITNIPTIEPNKYMLCFEDTELGDYDMNDVVLMGERLDLTHVKYTLMACGAIDELYFRNLDGHVFNKYNEIHKHFNAKQNEFINTYTINKTPVWEVFTVDKDFSFTNINDIPYIYNKTKDREIKISLKGEDPHGIMIPYEFRWPKEKICIKDAYTEFNNWGMNQITSTDWYKKPIIEKTLIIE